MLPPLGRAGGGIASGRGHLGFRRLWRSAQVESFRVRIDVCHRRISVTEEETGFGTEHFLIESERGFAIALEADVGRYFQL